MSDGKKDPLAALRAAGERKRKEAEAAKEAAAAQRRAALAGLKGAAPKPAGGDDDATRAALDALRAAAPDPAGDAAPADPLRAALDALRTQGAQAAPAGDDDTEAVLARLRAAAPMGRDEEGPKGDDGAAEVLAALRAAAPQALAGAGTAAQAAAVSAALDSLRAAGDAARATQESALDAALAALRAAAPDPAPAPDIAADPAGAEDPTEAGEIDDLAETGDLDDPAETGDLDDLDALLGDLDAPETPEGAAPADTGDTATPVPEDDPLAGLDDLLAEEGSDPAPADRAAPATDDPLADLADLGSEAGIPADPAPETAPDDGLDDLDALLDDAGAGAPLADPDPASADPGPAAPPQAPFGRLDAPRPDRAALHRPRFRMAVFGDFTGRAAAGRVEAGDALAGRRAIRLDVDTLDDVIAGFATTLDLPVTLPDGTESVIALSVGEIDDLHPDALFEKLPLFEELAGLRGQLTTASTSAKAVERLKAWGLSDGAGLATRSRSAGSEMPADRKLTDFQALIGGTPAVAATTPAAGADRLIAGIMGPHVVAAPDPEAKSLVAAVDDALSSAMRLVLHHPEFRALEAQWRSLDFLARRVETGEDVEIVLFDVSAEELGADLAAQEDLADSGLYRLLMEAALPEDQGGGGAGGFSALFGLYTFEETPPHAELLARIARIAAHVDAPFFTALAPGCLDTPLRDRHPLTARAWRELRELPEAGHLGLSLPRFMLRHPFGARTDPIDAFDFEEFTPRAGLRAMLWANPAVAVAALLAATRTQAGKLSEMNLGSVMSLGEMPFHHVTDAHGDQVALPCTERNLTMASLEGAIARGLMPLVSPRGRDEVRLASFQSLAGAEVLGPWADNVPAASPTPARRPDLQAELGGAAAATAAAAAEAPPADAGGGDLDDLDALLAGFEDPPATETGDAGDMDAELAALLEGL